MSTKNHGVGIQDHGDDPPPTMIREACRSIQSGWTKTEELQRRTGSAMAQSYKVRTLTTSRDRFGERMG